MIDLTDFFERTLQNETKERKAGPGMLTKMELSMYCVQQNTASRAVIDFYPIDTTLNRIILPHLKRYICP